MSVDTPTLYVPDDLFPVDDGIGLEVIDGVDPRYDLRRWMDPTMRNRPQWEDFGIAASTVLWELFEKHRIALKLAWTPQNCARVFKILALKLLGLDYRSDALTDDDYDRLVDTISLYNASKGPPHFVRYMGFMRGVGLEMQELWTENYRDFSMAPGIGWKTVIDDRVNGTWYPTPHVGILYDRYLNPMGVDEVELRGLFYKMAPIHLVLEWIAGNITVSVGTLWMVTNSLARKDVTLQVEWAPKASLYLSAEAYARTDVTTETWPDLPFVRVPATASVAGISVSRDDARVATGSASWCAGADDPAQLTSYDDPDVTARWRDAYGDWRWGTPPVLLGYDAGGVRLGSKLLPERLNWVKEARFPGAHPWSFGGGAVLAGPGAKSPSGATSMAVRAQVNQSFSSSLGLPVGSTQAGAVQWLVKPDAESTRRFAIVRGPSEYAVFDPATASVAEHVTSGVAAHGVEVLAGGFLLAWACLVGGDVELVPWWSPGATPSSAEVAEVDHAWLQAETEPYPSDLIDSGSVRGGRGGSTRLMRDASQADYSSGYGLVTFMVEHPEWEVGPVTLMHVTSLSGSAADLLLGVNASGNLTLRGPSPSSPVLVGGPVVAGVKRTAAFSWGAGSLRLHGVGALAQSQAYAAWPTNFNRAALGAPVGDSPYGTMWLDRALLVGSENASLLPSATLLNALSV